jgi:hypothetical protein
MTSKSLKVNVLVFSQASQSPDRYRLPSRLQTKPSSPSLSAAENASGSSQSSASLKAVARPLPDGYRTLIQPDVPSARTTLAQFLSHSATSNFVPPVMTVIWRALLAGDDLRVVVFSSRKVLP